MNDVMQKAVEAGARAYLANDGWDFDNAPKRVRLEYGSRAEAVIRAALPVIGEDLISVIDEWADARLTEANAPILSGHVFTSDVAFVSSTADAHAGYRMMDLATALRARLAEIVEG